MSRCNFGLRFRSLISRRDFVLQFRTAISHWGAWREMDGGGRRFGDRVLRRTPERPDDVSRRNYGQPLRDDRLPRDGDADAAVSDSAAMRAFLRALRAASQRVGA